MIRCYMGADRVVGFGHQFIKALIEPPPRVQALRARMESEWTPRMLDVLGIDAASLPIIWDADFLYGPRTASGSARSPFVILAPLTVLTNLRGIAAFVGAPRSSARLSGDLE